MQMHAIPINNSASAFHYWSRFIASQTEILHLSILVVFLDFIAIYHQVALH